MVKVRKGERNLAVVLVLVVIVVVYIYLKRSTHTYIHNWTFSHWKSKQSYLTFFFFFHFLLSCACFCLNVYMYHSIVCVNFLTLVEGTKSWLDALFSSSYYPGVFYHPTRNHQPWENSATG